MHVPHAQQKYHIPDITDISGLGFIQHNTMSRTELYHLTPFDELLSNRRIADMSVRAQHHKAAAADVAQPGCASGSLESSSLSEIHRQTPHCTTGIVLHPL